MGLLLFTMMSLLLKQGILLSAFKDFWRGHKQRRFYLKQGTFLRLLSSSEETSFMDGPLSSKAFFTIATLFMPLLENELTVNYAEMS